MKLLEAGHSELKPEAPAILQINVGKMCNQICKHCHVDAGPHRKEIMGLETMEQCLEAIQRLGIKTVDITGGAPEMNPNFRWFVESLKELDVHIMVRCNLTIINANPKYHDLPEFYAKHEVEVISSLPHFSKLRTDAQRGDGVFERSIDALQRLNKVGYGRKESDLKLDLVYNPTGAFLPTGQEGLEKDFKRSLKEKYGIEFNNLFAITNMPISRFLEYLISTENIEEYMDTLIQAFNPSTIDGLMCRNTLSIGWKGLVYDCDFNQMLDLELDLKDQPHISTIEVNALLSRRIKTGRHCFGCTAGAGSSCGGEIA